MTLRLEIDDGLKHSVHYEKQESPVSIRRMHADVSELYVEGGRSYVVLTAESKQSVDYVSIEIPQEHVQAVIEELHKHA